MLNTMCIRLDGECTNRYVASCQTHPRSITAAGERPATPITVSGNANVTMNTATLAMMIALTAGVMGPGPKATPE